MVSSEESLPVAAGERMIIDVVNQTDTPVGEIERACVFEEHADFRVSHVFIFNRAGQLLLQRLALTRRRNPGAWGSSVASYLFAAEGYLDAAKRRVGQELGVSGCALFSLGKTSMEDEGCLKFITLFQCFHEGPFQYDRSHIDQIEFRALPEVAAMINHRTRLFTPTFLRVFEFYRSLSLRE